MPRGGRRSTTFQKGNKGGPGRPKKSAEEKAKAILKTVIADVKAAAKEYTAEAIETLGSVMTDSTKPAAARVSAATVILDRGWGKPNVTIAGDPENPLAFKDVTNEKRLEAFMAFVERTKG